MVAGFALTLIAWPVGAEIRTAADVPADTLDWLGLLYGPIVSGFALICVYCYSRYDLDEDTHRQTLEPWKLPGPNGRAASVQLLASKVRLALFTEGADGFFEILLAAGVVHCKVLKIAGAVHVGVNPR